MILDTRAKVRYVNDEWRDRDEAPYINTKERRRANTSEHEVAIKDARPMLDSLHLDRQGFTLADFGADFDFHDDVAIKNSYKTVIAPFLSEVTGAEASFVASHLLRTEDQSSYITAYARFVHNDYSTGINRISEQKILDDNEHQKLIEEYDYAWFNLWTPFDHEVKQNALTLIDASTFDPDDCMDYHFSESKTAIASVPTYSQDHEFYYFSNMQPGEALVFKQLDSRENKARMCPHTAFYDTSVTGAPGRRSAEFRALCLFPKTVARD